MRFSLVVSAVVVRAVLLVAERSIGIDDTFHPDAAYYISQIGEAGGDGIVELIRMRDYDNVLFVVIGILLQMGTLGLVEVPTLLIAFNVCCAALTTWCLSQPPLGGKAGTGMAPAFFYAFSPYLAHLAVHPLKDTWVVLSTVLLVGNALRGRLIRAAAWGGLLVLSRLYLGMVTCGAIAVVLVCGRLSLRPRWSLLLWAAVFAVFLGLASGQFADRLEVQFEGRSFYPKGLVLVPESIEIRFLFGWLFNFLVPYPFIPLTVAEAGYFPHLLLFWMFVAGLLMKRRVRRASASQFALVLASMFLFSFILVVTPGAGPLVRYRLATELILLVALVPAAPMFASRSGGSQNANSGALP